MGKKVGVHIFQSGYNTPATGKPGGRGETMSTLEKIGKTMQSAQRILRQEWRRVVAFMVTFTFTFSMTGLDAIVAHAFDDYKQYQGSKLEAQRDALMSGTNPAENNQPDAFVDVANPDSLNAPATTALSDTSLNVLKSEYGDLLDTVSLQTLSERAASGANLDAMINEIVGQPANGTQGAMLTPEQPGSSLPQVDPSTMADIVTLQQGPLGMSLEMDNADRAQVRTGDEQDLARLPMPAAALKDETQNGPTETAEIPEQDANPVVETPQTPETQTAALPTNPDLLPQSDVQTNQVNSNDQQLQDQNQVQLPEEKQPDQQDVTLPKDQQQPDQKTDTSQNGNLTQQFLALLGLNPDHRTETVTTTQAAGENKEQLLPTTATLPGNETDVAPTDQPTQQQDSEQVVKNQGEPVVLPDGEQPVTKKTDEQTQTEPKTAKNPDQPTEPEQPEEGQSGQGKKPGKDQEKPGTAQTWTDQLKAFFGMDVTTPDRVESEAVETTEVEDTALPELPADQVDAQPVKEGVTETEEIKAPEVEVAEVPDTLPEEGKKPTETEPGEGEDKPEGEGQGKDDELTDQVLSMLGMPSDDEGDTAPVDDPALDQDITIVEGDLPPTDISATAVMGPNTVQIDVNALMVDQVQVQNDNNLPVENETPSPALVETPRAELQTNNLPVEQNLPQGDQQPVQNTQNQQSDQVGICMVGPDTTLRDPNQNNVQPAPGENEVKAASLVVQPDSTLRDPSQATVNPMLANSPLNTNANYTAINNQPNLVASLPNAVNQGGVVIASTQPINSTVQTAFTVPTIRQQIQPATTPTQPQLGVAPQTNPQMYDVNMQGMMMSSTPAPGSTGTIVPAGTANNIVTVVTAAVQAASNPNHSIPPRPTFEVSTYVAPWTGNAPADDGSWNALANEYQNRYDHPDPPEEKGGGGSGCASFMASPLGKILMFVVTVVLTIFTVGTAAPILLAIMIILEAILAFVPLPPALAMTLGIVLAFVGGWASALNSLGTTAAAAANITVTQAVQQIITNAGGLMNTLLLPAVTKAIIKAVIAKIIVDLFLMLCPEASPILTAFVSLAAGLLAGGLAEMIVDGKGFVDAFKASLNESLGNFFTDPKATVGTLLSSPMALQLYQVLVEAGVVQIMKSAGYTDAYAQLVGSMVSAFAVGGLTFALKGDQGNKFVNFVTMVMVQPIATTISTWYSTEVAPLLKEQGYSSLQTMHFAQNLAGFVNLFAPVATPVVNQATGEVKWKVTLTIIDKFEKMFKKEEPATSSTGTTSAKSDTTPPVQQKPVSIEPALEPKVANALQSPGLTGPTQTLGIRLGFDQMSQYSMPQLSMSNATQSGVMYSMMPPESTPTFMMGSSGSNGNTFGIGTGVMGAGVGSIGLGYQGGVMGASNYGFAPGPSLLSAQGLQGSPSALGTMSLNLYDSPLSPLRTDESITPLKTAENISLPSPVEAAKTSTSPEVKISDVQKAVEQPIDKPIEQAASPKPTAQDVSGDSSQQTKAETSTRPEVNQERSVQNPNMNIQPDTQLPQPESIAQNNQTSAPQEIKAPQAETAPEQLKGNSTDRNPVDQTPKMDESKPTTSQAPEIKDLKTSDLVKFEDPRDKAAKGGSETSAASTAAQTEETAKNNNRVLENSGSYSDAFVPKQDAAGQTPALTQATSGSPQPAAVQSLVNKLQETFVLPKESTYSYSQTQNSQGQTLTQVFNQQGQVIGAQVDLGNGTQITKTFDYQPLAAAQGAEGAASAAGTQVRTLTMENGVISEMQVSKIEGDKLQVIDRKTPQTMGGLDKTHEDRNVKPSGDTVERRNGDPQATAATDATKGASVQTPGAAAEGSTQTRTPQTGEKIQVNVGTQDQPVNVEMKFDPKQANQPMDIEAPNGKTYRVGYDAAGKTSVMGEVKYEGSFWSLSPKEAVFIPQGQTMGYGDKGNVYDCSGGGMKMVKGNESATFTDSQGKTIHMNAAISTSLNNLPSDVKDALVMLENLNSSNPLKLTEQQKTEIAVSATNTLQNYASNQAPGSVEQQQAMGMTYQAEQKLYSQNPNPQLLAQMSQHALQSSNPQLMMNAADLQIKSGQVDAAMNTIQQALNNNSQLPADQKASLQLNAANLMQSTGQTGEMFQQTMGDVANYFKGLEGKQIPPEVLTQALQYQSMLEKAPTVDPALAKALPEISTSLESISKQLGQQVAQAGSNLAEGQQRAVPELNGIVTKTKDGFALTQRGANETAVTTTFSSQGPDNTMTTSKIEIKPLSGGNALQVYEQTGGHLQLTSQQTTVETTMTVNGQKQTKMVDALLPVNRTGEVQTIAVVDGQPYVLTVGQDNRATAVLGHTPEANSSLNYQQELPTGIKMTFNPADNTATITLPDGSTSVVSGKTIQTMADVDALGIKAGNTADLIGKMAFTLTIPGKGSVTLIGSAQEIQAGNYYAAGTCKPINPKPGQEASVSYLAQYRGGNLSQVNLADSFKTTISYQAADLSKFTVTQTSADGQRVATLKYENNQLQGYGVEYKAFGLTLLYDAKGVITQECLQYLKENSGKGYTFKATSQGFSLTNNNTKFEAFFSNQGRALLNPGQGGTSGGLQEVMEFDIKQNVNFQVAKYDNGSLGTQTVHYDQITREHVLLQTSSDGMVTKTTITSDISGSVSSRLVENLNMTQTEKGTFSKDGLDTGTRDFQAKVLTGTDEGTGNKVRRENVTSHEQLEGGKVIESTMHVGMMEITNPAGELVQRMTDVSYKNGEIQSAAKMEAPKQTMTGVKFTDGKISYAATLDSGGQHMTGVTFRPDGSLEKAVTMTIAGEKGKPATEMRGVRFNADGTLNRADSYKSGGQTMTGVVFGKNNSISYAATMTIAGEQGKPATTMKGVTFNADGTLNKADSYKSGGQTMTGVVFGKNNSISYAATMTIAGEQGKPATTMKGVTFNADGTLNKADSYKSGGQTMTGVVFGKNNSISYAATMTIAEEQGKPATTMKGVTFNADGTLNKADSYKSGGQTMTGVEFGENNSINFAKTMTIDGEQGKPATEMKGVHFNADGTLKTADSYQAGVQTMTGVVFGKNNSIDYAQGMTVEGEKGKPATEMKGVRFNADGTLKSADSYVCGDQAMTGIRFGAKNSIEFAATVKTPNRMMYDVLFGEGGKIKEAGRIEETIARQDVKNDAGKVIGEERGVQRTLLNAKFDDAGNLISATQKASIAVRTEFNAENGRTTESRNIRSETRIEGGKIIESRTEVAVVQTRNAKNIVVDEQHNIVESLSTVSVSGRDVKVQITQTKDGSQVVINGNKEHQLSMGTDVRVTTDGKSLIIQDARGVLREFSPDGKETTGWFRERANNWHEFTNKISVAWNTYVDRLVRLDNWVMDSNSVLEVVGKSLVQAVAGVGAAFAFLGSVVLDASLTLVIQQVGAILGPTLEWTINLALYPVAAAVYLTTGESLGRMTLDSIKGGIAAAFAPIDRGIQAMQAKILGWAESALTNAELSNSQFGKWGYGALAAGLKVLGENLPIILIMAPKLIDIVAPGVGTAISAVLGTLLLAKDAVIHGLAHMYQTFFVAPFNNISMGLSQLSNALFNPQDSGLSQLRQVVNGVVSIGNGIVGLVFARQMLKEAFTEAKAEVTEKAATPAKANLAAFLEKGGLEALGKVMEMNLGKFLETFMKLPEGSLKNMSWSNLNLKEALYNHNGARISLGEMLKSPNGAAQLMMILKGENFRLGSLEFQMPAPKPSFTQRMAMGIQKALGREPQASGPITKPLTQLVRPSQIGQAICPAAILPAARVFVSAFINHQIQSLANVGRVMGAFGRWVGSFSFMQPVTRGMSSMVQAVQGAVSKVWNSPVARMFYPEALRTAAPGIAQALRAGSFKEAGSLAAAAFRQVGTNLQKALLDLPQAVKARLSAGVTLAGSGNAPVRAAEMMARTGMAENVAEPLTEATAKQRALDVQASERGETAEIGKTLSVVGDGQSSGVGESGVVKPTVSSETTGAKSEGPGAGTEKSASQGTGTKGAGAGVPSEAVAKIQGQVDRLQQTAGQQRSQLESAQKSNLPQGEIARLEQQLGRTENALQKAQANLHEQKIADLQAQKQQAAEIAQNPEVSPIDRQAAMSDQVKLDGEIQIQATKAQAASVEGNIRSLEAKAGSDPAVKGQVESLKKQLQELRTDEARLQQRQDSVSRIEESKMQQLKLGEQLEQTRTAETQAAQTPEVRKMEAAKGQRIEKEIQQAKAEQQVTEAKQKVLDFQTDLAKAKTTADFNRALIKLASAEKLLRAAQLDLMSAQKQVVRATQSEGQAVTNALLQEAASQSGSGMTAKGLRQGVDTVAKEQAPRATREAVVKAMAELLSGKASDPKRALETLESGTGSLQKVLESMVRNGLSQQAQKILDQLCETRGIKDQAGRQALARELGITTETAGGGKAANPGDTQALMEQAFGNARSSDPRYSAETRDALRSLGADLREGTPLDTAMRRSGSQMEQAFRQLEKAAGKDAVTELIKNMTAEQVREAMTSTNPLETLRNIQKQQASQSEQVTGAAAKETAATGEVQTAKEQAAASFTAAQKQAAAEVEARVEAARKQAVEQKLGAKDVETAVARAEAQAKAEASARVAEVKAQGEETVRKAETTLTEAKARSEALSRSGEPLSKLLTENPGKAEALLQRMQQVQEAGAAVRQAVDKVNQARTYAERQAAQKQLARAEQRLTQMERLAGIKPEAGRRIPFTSEWRASRQAAQESVNAQRTTYLKQQLNAVDNMRNLSPTERATLRELIQNELQILKLQGKQEGWLARRFESFRNRNASQMTSLYKARTQLVEALTTRTENGEKVYSNETVMKLLAAEGVSRGMMETAAVIGESFGKTLVRMLE
ncbi:MAG: hypothetical protein AB1439_11015, partial [candidate division FCPU426 bacterium]